VWARLLTLKGENKHIQSNLLQQMQPIVCNFQPSSSGRGKRPRRAALGHSVCSLTPTVVDHTHRGTIQYHGTCKVGEGGNRD
jgi:hypothetical protein